MGLNRQRVRVFYSGHVQGVGFRYTVKSLVSGFEVTGIIRNLADRRVELVAEGEKGELEEFLKAIMESGLGGLVRNTQIAWEEAGGDLKGFAIVG